MCVLYSTIRLTKWSTYQAICEKNYKFLILVLLKEQKKFHRHMQLNRKDFIHIITCTDTCSYHYGVLKNFEVKVKDQYIHKIKMILILAVVVGCMHGVTFKPGECIQFLILYVCTCDIVYICVCAYSVLCVYICAVHECAPVGLICLHSFTKLLIWKAMRYEEYIYVNKAAKPRSAKLSRYFTLG